MSHDTEAKPALKCSHDQGKRAERKKTSTILVWSVSYRWDIAVLALHTCDSLQCIDASMNFLIIFFNMSYGLIVFHWNQWKYCCWFHWRQFKLICSTCSIP